MAIQSSIVPPCRCPRRFSSVLELYVCVCVCMYMCVRVCTASADGSFAGDKWGEVDTRFSYCALSCLAILGRLDAVDVTAAVSFIVSCKNFDGGFGCVPGAESHAGQVFCCVGALSIAGPWFLGIFRDSRLVSQPPCHR